MKGANEYAGLFKSGQYGKLRIVSSRHARGYTFQIFIGQPDNEVEVYGVISGQMGWSEEYGCLHDGPWQEDFKNLVEERKRKMKLLEDSTEKLKQRNLADEKARIAKIMSNY
jgi:hypothetical protein